MTRVGQFYREKLTNRIKDNVDQNENVFLLSYSSISGMNMSELRKELKNAGASMFVSKNSIARLALKDLKFEPLAENVSGQSAFVWSASDSVEVSKILVKFAKQFETVSIQGGLLDGKILVQEDVKRLSDLPSRDVLLSMLLGTIQAPLTRLAGALNAKTRDLLSVLKQLSEKKGGS